MPQSFESSYLNAAWLINLRWVAVVGQIAAIGGAVFFFNAHIPALWALLAVISVTAVSNLVLTRFFTRLNQPAGTTPTSPPPAGPNDSSVSKDRSVSKDSSAHRSDNTSEPPLVPMGMTVLGIVMVMDMLSLTALLFATGGPNNPFFMFMFVNVSLGALVLNRKWAWSINVLANLCFVLITFEHLDVAELDMKVARLGDQGKLSLNHFSLLTAFATCSSVIVWFMSRLTGEVRKKQAEIRRGQIDRSRDEKMEALGTLAAGTAHELATPLSTIAIVARDVEQAFEKHPPDFPGAEDVIEDVHLIRSQLDRCRSIIDRMSSHSGEAVGESLKRVSLASLAEASVEGLIGRGRVHLHLPDNHLNTQVLVPVDGLAQAIRGLIRNALDADPSDRPVTVSIERTRTHWKWEIVDRGEGMTAEVLERVSEPFFTTKVPGKGMGLGVFLAKNVVRRLDGSVNHTSSLGAGTTVTILLPLAQ